MIFQLDGTPSNIDFPDPELAEREPDGLLAIGGDLDRQRIMQAYRQGIFPWYSEGQPILWWSPDPRTILIPEEIHVSRSLRKRLRKGAYQLRIDSAFESVLLQCAKSRENDGGTWLLPEMIAAYCDLNRHGQAHSIEVWHQDRLVGGLYGLSIGRVFFGESMFSLVSDASKIALVFLCEFAQDARFPLIDCQMYSGHLASLGAIELSRGDFLQQIGPATGATAADWKQQSKKSLNCKQLRHAQ